MSNKKLEAFFDRMHEQRLKLTYDDVRLNTDYSNLLPSHTDVSSRFSRNIPIHIPIISSAMDTVTEAPMAIALAQQGGLGIVHKNLNPKEQRKQVKKVKHFLNGRIDKPVSIESGMTIGDVEQMRFRNGFTFHSFPVVDENRKLVGMLTQRDMEFADDLEVKVSGLMTPYSPEDASFVTASINASQDEAFALMQEHKKNVIPLLSDDHRVVGMYVFSDLKRLRSKDSEYNVDRNGQLIVGAAVGAGDEALKRAELLSSVGCDVFVIDTAHGDSKGVINTVISLKERYPDIDVVAGNVSRGTSAKRLADAGADGVLVGQGPGSICTTRIVAGIGCPQVSAVYDCVSALAGTGIPVCADGGVRQPGDIAIALALGAESVMLGSLLAGTDESPGKIEHRGLQRVKVYRGMGSIGAMSEREQSRARYGQSGVATDKLVPEGIESVVAYSGSLRDVLVQYVGGLRASMAYLGAADLESFRNTAEIFRITNAGLTESRPHILQTT